MKANIYDQLIYKERMTNQQAANNLDPILYRLQAPTTYGLVRYPPLCLPNGQIFYGPNGETYQDFPWLPRRFNTCPSAVEIETWNRFHPQCLYADIEVRMAPGVSVPNRNALNMKRMREVRLPLGIFCWVQKTFRITVLDCLTAEQYTTDGVDFNTMLQVDYATRELVTPAWAVGNPLFPTRPLPWNSFLVNGQLNTPEAGLTAILDLMAYLQDLAQDQQLPHWLFLPNHLKPHWWSSATSDPNKINLPSLSALPHWSRVWLKECVRDAATPNNLLNLRVPPLDCLPPSSRRWIHECIIQGRGSISTTHTTNGDSSERSLGGGAHDDDELELDTIDSSPSPRPSPFAGLNHPSRRDDSRRLDQVSPSPMPRPTSSPRRSRRTSAHRRQRIVEDEEDENAEDDAESWEGFSDDEDASAQEASPLNVDAEMERSEDGDASTTESRPTQT
ncbi:MAG: hypothetical protein Q9187_003805 [Circinaria calcarea]